MINIVKHLKTEQIIPNLMAKSKEEAIKMLVSGIFKGSNASDLPLDKEKALEAVLTREELQSTGVGSAVAFPHARIPGWKELSLAVGISREGIDFGSIDKKPVNVIFLLLSSENEPYIILQAMATISRIVTESDIIEKILSGDISSDQLIKEFDRIDIKPAEQILASDIARPVINFTTLDTPIEDATRIMHLNRLDALPVLNEQREYCGEISFLSGRIVSTVVHRRPKQKSLLPDLLRVRLREQIRIPHFP